MFLRSSRVMMGGLVVVVLLVCPRCIHIEVLG